MREMTLRELFAGQAVNAVRGTMDRTVRGIAYDSRDVEPGFLFVAMDGQHTDGHRFIPDALRRGAASVLVSRLPDEAAETVSWVQVGNPRTALSPLAAAFHGHPSRSLKVIGVTGTDGKSSTVWFIAQLLGMLGKKAGFLSTVSFKTGDRIVKNPFRQSTPEATEIHGMLREMADIGKEYAVVEATSHGLSQRMNRLGDVDFDAAVLTNVTHEHLEFHGSFEQYRSDKANLFRALARGPGKSISCPRFAVVNADEPSADYFRAASGCPVHSYGVLSPADLAACNAGIAASSKRSMPAQSQAGSTPTNTPPSGPPYTVTTAQLSVVGGSDLQSITFAPVSVTTGTLSVVGGADTTMTFTPVVVTTGQLSVVGGP